MTTEREAAADPEYAQDVAKVREAARQLGVDNIEDGSWFRRLVAGHIKTYFAKFRPEVWDRVYPGLDTEQRADAQIKKVARKAAAAGAVAGLGASSGELLAMLSEGIAAPVGVPAAIFSMVVEAWYTAVAQVDLACDLASIYSVPFDSDDVGEVATLFGLALGVDIKKKKDEERNAPDERVHDTLTEKMIELKEGEIASRIGRKLLEEAVMRNLVPFVSIPISARWNYVATKKLGFTVKKYMRYRRALEASFDNLCLTDVALPALLLEGAWLLATVDGDAGHEEILALALVMDKLTHAQRTQVELKTSLEEDEEKWFDELAHAPASMHDTLLNTLFLMAATDRELQPGERRFLRRCGKVLNREVDCALVAQIAHYFASGENVPAGMLSGR